MDRYLYGVYTDDVRYVAIPTYSITVGRLLQIQFKCFMDLFKTETELQLLKLWVLLQSKYEPKPLKQQTEHGKSSLILHKHYNFLTPNNFTPCVEGKKRKPLIASPVLCTILIS